MNSRLIFPLFNALVGAIMGALVGYYGSNLVASTMSGALAGFLLALPLEFLLGALGATNWFYRRRVLFTILLEIPLVIFVVGPYVYVVNNMQPNPHAICCETPRDMGAGEYEHVRLQTRDGVTLAGWYVPPRARPGAVIVLLHGSHGDRLGTGWHARQLIQAGYGVLMYDQRALGESSGATTSFGLLDRADLLAFIEWLAQRPEVDAHRIGAVGLSLGGHIALNAAYTAPDKFAAIWADGIQAQTIQDFPVAKNSGEDFVTLLNAQILAMLQWRLKEPPPPSFTSILANLDRPNIVLVVGEQDDFESRVHHQYTRVLKPNVTQWFIPNAPHVGGPGVIPDEYKQRMLEFFDTNLGHTGG